METWLILLIVFPTVCAFIGYVTNVLAVRMIFHPREPVKIFGIKFQGVLPKHRRHFAKMLARIITTEFVDMDRFLTWASRPEAIDKVEAQLLPYIGGFVEQLKADLPQEQQALITPEMVDAVVQQISAELRKNMPEIMEAVRQRASSEVNLEAILTEKMMGLGAEGLESIMYEVSGREIRFIEYYGAVFGGLLGFLQFGVLYWLGDYALPIVGALVGTVTNWLAIQMLFYPRKPKKILGLFTYQGMFPKRQDEIAGQMAEVAARDLIIPEEILAEVMSALIPNEITVEHIERAEEVLRDRAPQMLMMLDSLIPADKRPELRGTMAARLTALMPMISALMVSEMSKVIDIDGMLTSELQALEKSEFEELLRGLFAREEIYLIIYGGMLGGIIGGIQFAIVSGVGG